MELKDALEVFKRKIGKKVIMYEPRKNGFIFITDTPNGKFDTNFYEITPNDIRVTNPVVCKLNKDKVVKL